MDKKILIVDDEDGIRESLKLILDNQYNLILTDGYDQCMDCLKNDASIGLVLLDIKLPRVNGLETLKEIKETYPHLKVVIITGYQSVETATEAASLGADDYITKPFQSNEILEMAQKQLG